MNLYLSAGASLSQSPDRGVVIPDAAQRTLRVFFGKQGYVLYRRIEIQQVFLRVHDERENQS